MAVVEKTIIAAGGGDYTTAQSWEDAADGEATDVWHGVITGSVGDCTFSAWSATVDADNRPTLRGASGSTHNGVVGAGATIGTIAATAVGFYLHVYDLNVLSLFIRETDNMTFERNIFKHTAATNQALLRAQKSSSGSDTMIGMLFQNNLFVCDVATRGIYLLASVSGTATATLTISILNNTMVGDASLAEGLYASATESSGGTTVINVTAKNNIFLDAATADMQEVKAGTGAAAINWTSSNNLTSDATADDFGGTGHHINQTLADVISASTYIPVIGGNAHNGGAATGLLVDLAGNTRPIQTTIDIGAFEEQTAAVFWPPYYYRQLQSVQT